jgi:hypothetical protein
VRESESARIVTIDDTRRAECSRGHNREFGPILLGLLGFFGVDGKGFEPLTSALRTPRFQRFFLANFTTFANFGSITGVELGIRTPAPTASTAACMSLVMVS